MVWWDTGQRVAGLWGSPIVKVTHLLATKLDGGSVIPALQQLVMITGLSQRMWVFNSNLAQEYSRLSSFLLGREGAEVQVAIAGNSANARFELALLMMTCQAEHNRRD